MFARKGTSHLCSRVCPSTSITVCSGPGGHLQRSTPLDRRRLQPAATTTTRRHKSTTTRSHESSSPRRKSSSGDGNKAHASSSPQRKSSNNDGMKWPLTANPTPYEIFSQDAGTSYSKARYFELAKVYHPDRYQHSQDVPAGLTHDTMVERYRLVCAANDILADPIKRAAYDATGAGWGELNQDPHEVWRARYNAWKQDPNSNARNAGWEDWERWRERQAAGASGVQSPVFMSNGGFVVLIMTCVVAAVYVQAQRMESRSEQVVEMLGQRHGELVRDLHSGIREQASLSRDARVHQFLTRRDGWGHDDDHHPVPPPPPTPLFPGPGKR